MISTGRASYPRSLFVRVRPFGTGPLVARKVRQTRRVLVAPSRPARNRNMDTLAIAHRARRLVVGPFHGDISVAAAFLGVEVLQLSQTVDRRNPTPHLDALVALVDVFRLDPAWLLFGECSRTEDTAPWWLMTRPSSPALRDYIEQMLNTQAWTSAPDSGSRSGSRARSRATDHGLYAVEREVSQRLSRACAHLPESDFNALVQRVAHVQWKYYRRREVGYRPQASGYADG